MEEAKHLDPVHVGCSDLFRGRALQAVHDALPFAACGGSFYHDQLRPGFIRTVEFGIQRSSKALRFRGHAANVCEGRVAGTWLWVSR